MPEIPRLSGPEAIAAFQKAGFYVARKRGSHRIMKKDGHRLNLSVPDHGSKPLGKGLLASLVDKSGLSVEKFCELL